MTADQGFCYSNGLLANGPLRASSGYAPIGKAAISGSESEKQYLAVRSGKWFDDPGDPYRIYSSVLVQTAALQTTTIAYQYDPLNRLTEAAYSGIFNGAYEYAYDAVGNRIFHSANITATESITYAYDVANRLQQSVDQDSLITTYNWDAMGRLITTTVGGNVSRVYQYSQDGKLLSADVDGLLTTFAYDGDGNRLLMSVAGEVTTYTLDYGNGRQILLEQGGAFAQTKHYLYGLSCIGELVDADDPETEEWRYYQRDGRNLVRQTTNSAAEITLAWAYSPDGAVLIGAKGPTSNLGCGNIYDWSTGLVFKNGRYFDPNLGIWLTLAPFVVWQQYKLGKRGGKSRRKRHGREQLFLALLFLLVVALTLVGCDPNAQLSLTETPTCTPTLTPDPTGTPTPTQPPGLPPNTPTPIPTIPPRPPTETPWPSPTPSPTPRPDLLSFPYPFKLSNPFGDKEIQVVQPFGVNWGGADAAGRSPLGGGQANGALLHNGIDSISGGDAPHWLKGTTEPENTRDVYAPVTGAIEQAHGSTVRIQQIEYNGRIIEGLEVRLTHVNINRVAAQMNAGSGPITEYGNYGTTLPHLHISVILYYENFSQRRISRSYSGEAVYYDPRPLLQEYGPIDYDYSQ